MDPQQKCRPEPAGSSIQRLPGQWLCVRCGRVKYLFGFTHHSACTGLHFLKGCMERLMQYTRTSSMHSFGRSVGLLVRAEDRAAALTTSNVLVWITLVHSHVCVHPCLPTPQIDYLQAAPKANVVTAARKLNAAIAWMYTAQPAAAPKLGLANCVWVLDDTAASGGLACVQDRSVKIQSLLGVPAASAAANGRRRLQQAAPAAAGSKRYILVPANPALTLRLGVGGKMGREVKGIAGKPQLLDLSLSATDLQVAWV